MPSSVSGGDRADEYFAIVPIKLLSDVSANAVVVYAVLAEAANRDGVSWPSLATIGKRIGKSDQAARRGKNELVEAGWLIERGRSIDGRRSSNEYTVLRRCKDDRSGRVPVSSDRDPLSDSIGTPLSDSIGEPDPEEPDPENTRESFDAFWQECPKKVGKKAAAKAWERAVETVSAVTIIDAMRAHRLHWERAATEQRFIPHPATWLNQGRWDDELAQPPPADDGVDPRLRGPAYQPVAPVNAEMLAALREERRRL